MEERCKSIFEKIMQSLDDNPEFQRKAEKADSIYETIRAYFEKKDLKLSVDDSENRLFGLGFSGLNTTLKTIIHVDALAESLCINTTLPITCREEYRLTTKSLLNDLNGKLRYGAFHLTASSDEVVFQHSYSFEYGEFHIEQFEKHFKSCLMLPDIHFRSISKAAEGSLTEDEKGELFQTLMKLAGALRS